MTTRQSLTLLCVVAAGAALASCSTDESDGSATPSGVGGTAGSSTTSPGGAGGAGLGTGGDILPDPTEICDGLDNDSNGTVDEVCTCTGSATQPCYPAPQAPPEGCRWGEQICADDSWGSCSNATLPPEGEDACCTALDGTAPHPLYDAFLLAYPSTNMPASVAEVTAFAPQANGHGMVWTQVNPGNELVDDTNGGVITANIEAGRAMSRQAAESSMPVGATVEDVVEGPVTLQNLGGSCDGTPSGVGWAWGSLLYQTPDEAVGELVYLYVGLCSDGDVEAFYYSEEPLVICQPPQIPR